MSDPEIDKYGPEPAMAWAQTARNTIDAGSTPQQIHELDQAYAQLSLAQLWLAMLCAAHESFLDPDSCGGVRGCEISLAATLMNSAHLFGITK